MTLRPVIIAGGVGSRLWPESKSGSPKQFLPFGDKGESLIKATSRRAAAFSSEEKVLVVTGEKYLDLCSQHLPKAKLIAEPFPKNTAMAVGLGAVALAKEDPDAVMLILWADSAIGNEEEFSRVINLAYKHVQETGSVGVIGIVPTSAHTGYGYIEASDNISDGVHKLNRFVEKPDSDTAEKFVEAGNFYWNPGIFVWKVSTILNEFKKSAPEMYEGLMNIHEALGTDKEKQVIEEEFTKAESISVDCAVMEKLEDGLVFPAENMKWSDVGSWDAWGEYQTKDEHGNAILGNAVTINSKNNIISSNKKMVATVGVENLVIVETEDSLLVCHVNEVQNVKKVVEKLKEEGRTDLI